MFAGLALLQKWIPKLVILHRTSRSTKLLGRSEDLGCSNSWATQQRELLR